MRLSVPQSPVSDASIAPIAGMSSPDNLLTTVARPHRFRRPSRLNETSDRIVARAIPVGFMRPAHTDDWVKAVETHPVYELARADLKRALRRCVQVLVDTADFATMTTRPTWERVGRVLQKARTSVSRYFRQLREMGLLAVVASGRSAQYAPPGEGGERANEAGVYVLYVPQEQSVSKDRVNREAVHDGPHVDRTGTPPREAGYRELKKEVNPRTRARREISRSEEQKQLGLSVEQIRWNRHRVPTGKAQRITAAWRLKSLLPNVLGRMSNRDIAAAIRDFFLAGWSVADLHHALDHRPDGGLWPYAGAPDTKEPHRVRGWLRFRLSAWRTASGIPMPSRGQQNHAEREKVLAERRAEEQAQRRQREQLPEDPEIKRLALARIRAVLSGR